MQISHALYVKEITGKVKSTEKLNEYILELNRKNFSLGNVHQSYPTPTNIFIFTVPVFKFPG